MKPVLKGFIVVAREALEQEFGPVCDPTVSHWLLMQIVIDSELRRIYRRISLN
jgi:RNA polymerase subunit RPABC4/transcription elongation factor Spt4